MLPTFLVIGTMKGGTTSIYHYLSGHPQVFMSATKELHYFVAEKNLARGQGWYERNFRDSGGVPAVGEASPDYTKYPIFRGVPERIARTVPAVKLLYVIRNPLERIRSHYLHDVARGRERRPISEAVPGNLHYLAPSRYALQIEQYLEHFPREQLLIITSEALRSDRRATMRRVHDFLGVDAEWSAPTQQREFNGIATKTAPGPLLRAARQLPGASRLRLLAPGAVTAAERLLHTTRRPVDVRAGAMSDELQRRLIDELAPDLERLPGHLGEDFEAWGLR
jgi:Sulfotransferase domain